MRLAFLVPIGFAAGAVLARALLSHAPPDIAVDRMQPLVVVTYWQHFGFMMWLALFIAIAVASVGYVAALRAPLDFARGWFDKLTMTIACSAIACAAALAFPVVFSSDVYAYAGYGWLALHGVSPYAQAAITMRNPLMDAVLWQWGNPPPVCVYGPAFVWFAQTIVALFGGLGPAAPLWALRISACATLVLCAPLAYHAFANFPMRTRLAAAAGITLNPVAIWTAAEGHNDVFLIAIVLAGFALLARSQLFAGALVLALSAVVKLPGLLAAAAAVAFSDVRNRSQFARLAAGVAAGLCTAALIGWPALAQLSRNVSGRGQYFPQFSLQSAMSFAFGDAAAIAIATVLALSGIIAGCILLWRRRAAGAPLLAIALWIAIPNPYPWYVLWILPVAFIAWETPAAWAIVALTLCTAARYLPDATTDLSNGMSLAIVCAELALPIAVFGVAAFRRAQGDRMSRYRVHLVILATLVTAAFAGSRVVAAVTPPGSQSGWLASSAGPAPERGARLIFSGDSITAGYGVNDRGTVPGCLASRHSSPCFADLVTSFFPGTIEVNDGVPTSCLEATTAAHSICNVAYSGALPLIARYRKTMLPYAGRNRNWFFIHIGVNDLGSASIRGDTQVNVATFKANYSEIVSALESAGTRSNQIVLAQITYSNATSPAMTFLFNSAIADVAIKYHTRLSNEYRATALCNVPCLTDGTHPNNLGHAKMAAEDEQANFLNAVSSEGSYNLAAFIINAQIVCRAACRLPLTSGTVTWKFGVPYASTPVCTATAEGAPSAGAPALFETISPSEITVTSTLPTDNRAVDIRCEGQI